MELYFHNKVESNNLVYSLIDPNDKEIRYIGKTIQGIKRIYEHLKAGNLKNDGNTPKANWLRKLLNAGQYPEVRILYQFNGNFNKFKYNEILYKKEQELINFYLTIGYDLTNLQDGGPGSPNRPTSELTRKKMSESAKKRGLPQALKDQQKPKFNDPEGMKFCSICLEVKFIQEMSQNKKNRKCKTCFNKLRPSRIVPGARKAFVEKVSHKVSAKNIKTNEEIIFSSMREAVRKIGGKFNRLGIKRSIKNQTPYYGYIWRKI